MGSLPDRGRWNWNRVASHAERLVGSERVVGLRDFDPVVHERLLDDLRWTLEAIPRSGGLRQRVELLARERCLREELAAENLGLVPGFLRSKRRLRVWEDSEEFVSELLVVYLTSISRYRPELGTLSNFCWFNFERHVRLFRVKRNRRIEGMERFAAETADPRWETVDFRAAREESYFLELLPRSLSRKGLLNPVQRLVVHHRFFGGLTLERTGMAMGGLTKERVRQIQNDALKALRADLMRRADRDPVSARGSDGIQEWLFEARRRIAASMRENRRVSGKSDGNGHGE